MEAEVEGVEVWRCVSLTAELEGVGWTVELAACGISVRRDLIAKMLQSALLGDCPRPRPRGERERGGRGAACGTVVHMALVIAARYSELPSESAAPPPRQNDRFLGV